MNQEGEFSELLFDHQSLRWKEPSRYRKVVALDIQRFARQITLIV
jgi:hypothetical protein